MAVDLQTVKAVLTEQALARLEATSYRFCADALCNVVYFGGTGSCFGTADLRVPVWQKLPSGSRPVCYCFGESEASIRAEIELTGQSLAVERIREHIRAGRCACDVGRCRRVQRLLQRKLAELDTRLMQLQEFRQSLEGYLAQCDRTLEESPEAECPVVEDLRRTK